MHINLIPTSDIGVSYGIWTMIKAIEHFKPFLLAVIRIIQETNADILDDKVEYIEDQTFILLFREPGSIGMITGFINEWGTNINASGTGGGFGQDMVDCLNEYGIKPIEMSKEQLFEKYPDLISTANSNIGERLPIWTRFIGNEIVTILFSDQSGLFTKYTGGWEESWKAETS